MIMASLTALVVALWLFPSVIKRLAAIGTQPIRDDGVAHHVETKRKTPTAGGNLIMASVVFSTLLWGDLQNHYVLVLLAVMTLFALVVVRRLAQDRYQDTKGLSGKLRLLVEFTVAFGAVYWRTSVGMETRLDLPASKWQPDLGVIGTVLFGGFVIVQDRQRLQLTDGLDGLAIGPVLISAATLLALAYIAGTPLGVVTDWGAAGAPSGVGDPAQAVVLADYLKILRVPGVEEAAVVAAALLGAGMSFLWFNAHPASVFMGDTGSLGLGGALGLLAVMTRKELFSAVLHGLFLFNALSVIIQVFWYKRTGKRVFRMAPFHHHLELGGWAETKVVIRWWLLSIVLALAAVALLKIR